MFGYGKNRKCPTCGSPTKRPVSMFETILIFIFGLLIFMAAIVSG